jgi:glycosyltransferase involved in cell wall biosynthesis
VTPKPSVVLLHNRYREPGGEERSVAAMASLLGERGHRVEMFERSSAELAGAAGRVRAGAAMLRGGADPARIADVVRSSGADVAHFHNLNPLLGWRALKAAREAGARVVMHLHNYRLFCSIAIAFRDHDICMRCRDRNTLPGVRLRCRGNLPEAATYAAGLSLQLPRVLESVNRFVVPSRAAAERLASFGVPDDRMDVLHNFLPLSEMAAKSSAAEGRYALFAGRLVEEKGADTAIKAARRAGVPLVVAGSGPDEARLRQLAGSADVRFTGRLTAAELAELRRGAALALAPSRWPEPCPYVVIEAMAAGLPVLASDVGGLPEMVGADSTLPPRGATVEWAAALEALWSNPRARARRGDDALSRARRLFGDEHFYSGLSALYELVQLA